MDASVSQMQRDLSKKSTTCVTNFNAGVSIARVYRGVLGVRRGPTSVYPVSKPVVRSSRRTVEQTMSSTMHKDSCHRHVKCPDSYKKTKNILAWRCNTSLTTTIFCGAGLMTSEWWHPSRSCRQSSLTYARGRFTLFMCYPRHTFTASTVSLDVGFWAYHCIPRQSMLPASRKMCLHAKLSFGGSIWRTCLPDESKSV